jgi:hypothetical protein
VSDNDIQILWDPVTKTALVVKGDQTATVPGTHVDWRRAAEAGLTLCRKLGWIAVESED